MIGKTNSGGVMPTGSITLSANGTYNITNYSEAVVNVSSPVEDQLKPFLEGTLSIISDTTISQLKSYAFVFGSYENIYLPNVEIINDYAFSNCFGLGSIVHFDKLKYIGDLAFRMSNSASNYITEFYGGSLVSFVGASAFYQNKVLTHVDFLSMNLSLNLDTGCFGGCSSLTTPIICHPTAMVSGLNSLHNVPLVSLTHSQKVILGNDVLNDFRGSLYISAPTIQLSGATFYGESFISKIDNTVFNGLFTYPVAGITNFYSCFAFCNNLSLVEMSMGAYNDDGSLRIPGNCFSGCVNLSQAKITFVTSRQTASNFSIRADSAFSSCTALERVQFIYSGITINNASVVLSMRSTFYGCTSLKTFNAYYSGTQASVTFALSVGSDAFRNCTQLTHVPVCNGCFGTNCFLNCTQLSTLLIDYRYNRNTVAYAFSGCGNFSTLYLYSTALCPLDNSNFFAYTPFKDSSYLGYYGSIYVRQSLLSSYQTSTNWTYYSDRFVGITDEEMEQAYQDYLSVGRF